MEERSLFHRMRQIFREEGETEEVGSQAMKLIRNIVRYLDKDAKDIMTHRRDIVGIDEEVLRLRSHIIPPVSRIVSIGISSQSIDTHTI